MRRYRKINESYEGFETWYNALRMAARMHVQIFVVLLLLNLTAFGMSVYFFIGPARTRATVSWLLAEAVSMVSPRAVMRYRNPDGSVIATTAGSLAEHPGVKRFAKANLKQAGYIYLACGLVFLLWPLVAGLFKRRARAPREVIAAMNELLREYDLGLFGVLEKNKK